MTILTAMSKTPLSSLFGSIGPAASSGAASRSSLATAQDPLSSAREARSGRKTSPGEDVTKKLKALGDQMLAVMMISDPAKRAKAAADLYDQYAQTAKDYAAATADGRAAAATASAATPTEAGEAADPTVVEAVPAEAPVPPMLIPAAPAGPGGRSGFVADVFMEQIKLFAKGARDVYDLAVQEARAKGDDKEAGTLDDRIKAAEEVLTEAAQAVEGPAATAEGYDPLGAVLPRIAPPVLDMTA